MCKIDNEKLLYNTGSPAWPDLKGVGCREKREAQFYVCVSHSSPAESPDGGGWVGGHRSSPGCEEWGLLEISASGPSAELQGPSRQPCGPCPYLEHLLRCLWKGPAGRGRGLQANHPRCLGGCHAHSGAPHSPTGPEVSAELGLTSTLTSSRVEVRREVGALVGGGPGGTVGENLPMWGRRFDPWSGTIDTPWSNRARGPQLLKHVRLELVLCKRGHFSLCSAKSVPFNSRVAPTHHTRESPRTATKTQHSQK